jgi:hypothetical protein
MRNLLTSFYTFYANFNRLSLSIPHEIFAMTNSGGNSTLIQNGLLTSDRAIFVVVSATIIGVLVEIGIIRVSGFVGVRDLSLDIAIFVGLGIFCVFSQLMILNFVRNKIGRSFLSHNRIGLLNKVIVLIQLGILHY